MPSIIPAASTDLDHLLEALDAADKAVRDHYRRLADDPDLAAERAAEPELHARRTELSRQVAMGALAAWRAARSVVEAVGEESTGTSTAGAPTPEPVAAPETNGGVLATMSEPEPPSLTALDVASVAPPSSVSTPVVPPPSASAPIPPLL